MCILIRVGLLIGRLSVCWGGRVRRGKGPETGRPGRTTGFSFRMERNCYVLFDDFYFCPGSCFCSTVGSGLAGFDYVLGLVCGCNVRCV